MGGHISVWLAWVGIITHTFTHFFFFFFSSVLDGWDRGLKNDTWRAEDGSKSPTTFSKGGVQFSSARRTKLAGLGDFC